jgi:hypothetical protein
VLRRNDNGVHAQRDHGALLLFVLDNNLFSDTKE